MVAHSFSPEPSSLRDGVDGDGGVTMRARRVPFSAFASDAARAVFLQRLGGAPAGADIAALRQHYGALNDALAREMAAKYAVDIVHEQIGGVGVQRVTPRGLSPGHGRRLLINLHGGGFMWGAGSGALVEAIPIAAAANAIVIAVDYRMAPQHIFPAASEDVCAVYKALLSNHAPDQIGIYGCSAGAILTAQTIAWLKAQNLPLPGAVAMLCGAGEDFSGDSAHIAAKLTGDSSEAAAPSLFDLPYFQDARRDDPLALPACSDDVLAVFPPSLLITATRDFAASGVTHFHRRLVSNGVDARLFVFDGLWHAFQIFCELPESEETYRVMADFFARTLRPHT